MPNPAPLDLLTMMMMIMITITLIAATEWLTMVRNVTEEKPFAARQPAHGPTRIRFALRILIRAVFPAAA